MYYDETRPTTAELRSNNAHWYAWQLTAAELAVRGEYLLARMRKRWPACFGTVKPLKLGIRADLIAARVSEQDADVFLRWYVQTEDYLRAQSIYGAMRCDLKGRVAGPVSAENAEYAAALLDTIRYQKFRCALIGDGHG